MLDQHAASDAVKNLCVFRFHARALARGENQNSEIFHRLFLSIGRIWGTDPEFLLLQNSGSVPPAGPDAIPDLQSEVPPAQDDPGRGGSSLPQRANPVPPSLIRAHEGGR